MATFAHTKAMADKNEIDFLRLAQESNIFTEENFWDMFTATASDILQTSTGRTETSDRMGDNRIYSTLFYISMSIIITPFCNILLFHLINNI